MLVFEYIHILLRTWILNRKEECWSNALHRHFKHFSLTLTDKDGEKSQMCLFKKPFESIAIICKIVNVLQGFVFFQSQHMNKPPNVKCELTIIKPIFSSVSFKHKYIKRKKPTKVFFYWNSFVNALSLGKTLLENAWMPRSHRVFRVYYVTIIYLRGIRV